MRVVGKATPRIGADQIVTGGARYIADLEHPGLLSGALLYPPTAPARIVSIDVSEARALPGVVAVLTHADIPGLNRYTYSAIADQPLLASEFVRYPGDAVVAVAALDDDAAQAAIEAVRIEYQQVDGVFDVIEAMQPDAPQVWPDRPNVHSHLVIKHGDIDDGFAAADVIIDEEYSTQLIEQAFLEPEGAVAIPEPDGSMLVHASSQAPHGDRAQIAKALGMPEHMVRVVVPYVGGGFGGKLEVHVQIHAALLAQATGRPVRLIRSREESIRTHVKRHPIRVRCKTGATNDGMLTAIHVEAIGDTGPYVNAGADVMSALAATAAGPYRVPHARVDAYTVHTNNPTCGAMRGFGVPQGTFARERNMDRLARRLGLDPLEIRHRNGLETGATVATGAVLREGRPMKECLEQAARLSGWREREQTEREPGPHLRRGWGLAASMFTVGIGRGTPDSAGVSLEMAADGSVLLRTGAADMGQGAHTALAQMAAEGLGVELDAVRVVTPDTDRTPDAGPACASRTTFLSGNAAERAAATVRNSLLESAAVSTGRPIEELTLRDGYLHAEGEQVSTIAEVAAAAKGTNYQLHANGHYAMEYPEELAEGAYPYLQQVFTFGAQVAQVLVDVETGVVEIEDLTVVQDAGRMINPDGVIGQVEGGAAMGVGYALFEELLTVDGRTINDSLENYLVPTAMDVPPMKVGVVEIPEPLAPFGAKGVGEPTITPTAPAIANAIFDAIGCDIDSLPLNPERVLAAIGAARQGQASTP
jgi:xanthine dehydrogenase molybdenum-binding subunit